jgi:glycosyltransferase involved in cell wall biosynthesis
MHLIVVSHKLCWASADSLSGYVTDGGFPLQMEAISELFTDTTLVVPCGGETHQPGVSPLVGHNLSITPLSNPTGSDWRRKIGFPLWLAQNIKVILREVRRADAVHTPIPGDVGTIGMLLAFILRKPLFVRHCGNWFVQATAAERFWKWFMERFAGGRNVMLATGGHAEPPSTRNPNVKWIFSTSLRERELGGSQARRAHPNSDHLRLIIACRQENEKGTGRVINSLPLILKNFPQVTLDVVGDGGALARFKEMAASLGMHDRVTFHGKLKHSAVIHLLRQANLFCYPTSASEGFPKAVLEALACGLPVITTRVSVLPQLIGSGCGILLDENTPEALAQAVAEIVSDPDRYSLMSAQAAQTARQYSLERWRDTIGEALQSGWGRSLLRGFNSVS